MTQRTLVPVPLTRAAFAPFGDVIEAAGGAGEMNDGAFEQFPDLSRAESGAGGEVAFGIVRCAVPANYPRIVTYLERHPLASQAFVPLDGMPFVVVVAPAADEPDPAAITAFVSDGKQGVNYRRGTWHAPLAGARRGQTFLVVDRLPGTGNYDERELDVPLAIDWRP